jgi:hypothetical protein
VPPFLLESLINWGGQGQQIFLERKVELDKYIFISPETMTYQPNTDSPEPDFDGMRLMGFDTGQTLEDALKDILELNEDMEAKRPGQTFHLDYKNEHRKYFRLKEFKTATRIAS